MAEFTPTAPVERRANRCKKCEGDMQPGQAIAQTVVYSHDFPGDELGSAGQTMNYGGPGKLIGCMKCAACGWSVTGTPAVTRQQILDAMHEYASMFHACCGNGPEVVAKRAAVVALLDEAGVA